MPLVPASIMHSVVCAVSRRLHTATICTVIAAMAHKIAAPSNARVIYRIAVHIIESHMSSENNPYDESILLAISHADAGTAVGDSPTHMGNASPTTNKATTLVHMTALTMPRHRLDIILALQVQKRLHLGLALSQPLVHVQTGSRKGNLARAKGLALADAHRIQRLCHDFICKRS